MWSVSSHDADGVANRNCQHREDPLGGRGHDCDQADHLRFRQVGHETPVRIHLFLQNFITIPMTAILFKLPIIDNLDNIAVSPTSKP